MSPPPSTPFAVMVHAYGRGCRWRGIIDLEEWLEKVDPGTAAQGCPIDQQVRHARALFAGEERPLDMQVDELRYDVLRIADLPAGAGPAGAAELLSLRTAQGRIWLEELPMVAGIAGLPLSDDVLSIPLPIQWRIGIAEIAMPLLRSITPGDALLVQKKTFDLLSAGSVIASFSINEDGEFCLSPLENAQENELPATRADQHADASETLGLQTIPVRLDFVLQSTVMTVSELDALYRGQVLTFDEEVERTVKIFVNSVCVARGELVEINGRLAMEVQEVLFGQNEGKRRV